MVQVDLITGFLGAGKTTFLRKYAAYLVAQGHNVCILENDFGAVNVDAMLVQDLLGERCEIETISGGCDCDTHQRRMRTKLISMGGEPLDRWYRLGNVIAIVDALVPGTLSAQADYILASEAANAGAVVFSRSQLADAAQREAAQEHLNRALAACKCSRTFRPGELLTKPWDEWGSEDFAAIDRCGCRQASCEKLHFDEHRAFGSAYFLELGLSRQQLEQNIPALFTDPACGHVLRAKGFVQDENGWVELNATADGLTANAIPKGQEVLIVIGEGLEKERIEERLKG